jgi:hypothetical protein
MSAFSYPTVLLKKLNNSLAVSNACSQAVFLLFNQVKHVKFKKQNLLKKFKNSKIPSLSC